jgi:Calcineurin-like phosphoesterase
MPAPDADLLVLAGDIGSYQSGSRVAGADFGLDLFSPLQGWPVPVLYVPGNHEYDMLDFDATYARLQETCARLGITWLDRRVLQAADIPGLSPVAAAQNIRFIGSTLWADFDALGPTNAESPTALADQLKARQKAFKAANWYLNKTGTTRLGAPMLAEQVREEALDAIAWLRSALAAPGPEGSPHSGKTVVVTHFAPSLLSADPRYGLTPGTAGFCNALDDLLPLADLWLHGHLHSPSDYRKGRCRVVANPMGYARKGEQAGFKAHLALEIGP